jgi:hypothetical protein
MLLLLLLSQSEYSRVEKGRLERQLVDVVTEKALTLASIQVSVNITNTNGADSMADLMADLPTPE